MEYNSNEILYQYFQSEIEQMGKEEIKKLEAEIKRVKDREIKKISNEVHRNVNRFLNVELRDLNTDHSAEINKINNQNNRLLMEKRLSLLNRVFDKVTKKLLTYTSTDEYKVNMKNKMNDACKILDCNDVVLTIKKGDDIIKSIFEDKKNPKATLVESYQIEIGGFIASSSKLGIEINETLDVRLEEKKQWFFENSNLFIRK